MTLRYKACMDLDKRRDTRMRVAILGCTGSIGFQALDVCRQHTDKIQVVALTAHSNTHQLVANALEFGVSHVVVSDEAHRNDPVLSELPDGCTLSFGSGALADLPHLDDVDIVLVAVVGAVGLEASYATLKAGKRLALANKEPLVAAGDLLMPLAAPGQLLPVDSEHSAIYQCSMVGEQREVHLIWLTCSGGPFFGCSHDELARVGKQDALAHPNWSMGAKISIDSATLMNKGLERIEAMHLFDADLDQIQIVIQRESKIHSMVEYADGSVMAHMGTSDMRIPIQFAFSYPERWSTPAPRIDYRELGKLTFDAPDVEAFPSLRLADFAGRTGGTMPCVLNAANEVAVEAFLQEACSFNDIPRVVETCMEAHDRMEVSSLEQLHEVDAWARSRAAQVLASLA